jgi:hypothetical protein
MENISFDEEMKKLYCEIQEELQKKIQIQINIKNHQFAITAILSTITFVFTTISSVEMIMSNNDTRNTAVGIFATTSSAIYFYLSVKRVDRPFELLISDLIQLLCIIIDEESQGYLSDLKFKWINSGLSQEQIKINELIFLVDNYWGRFIAWMRFPRFSNSTRIR